jgi:hypothetical protein
LLHENTKGEQKIHGLLCTDKQHDAKLLLSGLQPEGNKRNATFVIEHKNIKEVETEVLEKIKKLL